MTTIIYHVQPTQLNHRQKSVRVFLSGDYEFLSRMYGISGASGATVLLLTTPSAYHLQFQVDIAVSTAPSPRKSSKPNQARGAQ